MKSRTLIAGLVIVALNASALIPEMRDKALYFAAASILTAIWLVVQTALAKSEQAAPEKGIPSREPRPIIVANPEVKNLSSAEALALLGVFQQKGRLIDFLMDDISAYGDAQVGAAARVVQQGCKEALHEHFTIVPVTGEKEGTRITVPEAAAADEYSLVGTIAGEPPFSGTLVHKGWKATSVKLPRSLQSDPDRLPPIAPAQVELK